jgi:hypothetical protein
MLRIILLLSFLLSAYSVVPIMSMTRRIYYSRTQYLVPCTVCKNALLNEMEYPSSYATEFIKKAPVACEDAAKNKFEQQGCIDLLTKHARSFVNGQRRGDSVHSSCAHTLVTDCTPSETKFTILCDKKKKKGYCHIIPTD